MDECFLNVTMQFSKKDIEKIFELHNSTDDSEEIILFEKMLQYIEREIEQMEQTIDEYKTINLYARNKR